MQPTIRIEFQSKSPQISARTRPLLCWSPLILRLGKAKGLFSSGYAAQFRKRYFVCIFLQLMKLSTCPLSYRENISAIRITNEELM